MLFSMVSCWVMAYGQTAPFYEQINSCSLPTGWSATSTSVWKFTGSMGWDATSIDDNSGVAGSCFIWADGSNYGTSGQTASLTTDSIDMSALSNPELKFFLSSYNPSYVGANGNNTLSIDFYDGTTWHDSIYGHSGNLTNPWNAVVIPLNLYTISGKALIRFTVTNTSTGQAYYNDIGIDDIRVDDVQTCFPPTNFTSSTSTTSSITLSWTTGGATAWEVEYGPVGHQVGTGTVITASSNSGYVLSGLGAGSIYDIYVRDYCSAGDQSYWTGPLKDTTLCSAALSGVYTINQNAAASATNFTSFSGLANALSLCGVSGPVTVNVVAGSGAYKEQITFQEIAGASATNTVTINGNGVMIADSGNVGPNYATILMDGVDYLTIDSLHIVSQGTSNRVGVLFTNQADYNVLRNSVIEMTEATTGSVAAVAFSNSLTSIASYGNNGNYNILEGNTTQGGYYAVRQNGTSSSVSCVGNQYLNNKFLNFYYYGIYSYYQDSTIIVGNEFARPTRTSVNNFYPLYLNYTQNDVKITENWIHDGFTQATGTSSAMYGVYSSNCDNITGRESVFANNIIEGVGSTGSHYMIYNGGSDGWLYYHNTIVENTPTISGTSSTRLFYQTTSASGIEFKNNLLYCDRGTTGQQYLLYLNTTASNIDVDNNAYYIASKPGTTYLGRYGTSDVVDLTGWQAVNASAFDQNSFEGDPFFADLANGDLTPSAAYFNNIGTNLQSVVSQDYLGNARGTAPDPGALEFTPPPGPDISILNIYPPAVNCGSSADIIVEFINQGLATVTSFTLNYTVGGVAQTPIAVTGSFATGTIDSVTITGIPVSSAAFTNVIVTAVGIAPGTDIDPSNNFASTQLLQGLSGNYTINSSAPASNTNFISFNSLASALTNYGVCGNVIVDVIGVSVTYTDQFWLSEVPGVSATSTITINGNGNTLEYLATSSDERATITLDGTDWVTIDSLNVNALGSASGEYGFGILLTNDANNNTISNCIINVEATSTSSSFTGIAISASLTSAASQGAAGSYNTIEDNQVTGGYYGITSFGMSSDSANGNIIRNNEVKDFYSTGIYVYYSSDVIVEGNEVSRPNRTNTTTFYGLNIYYSNSARVVGNIVHDGFSAYPTSTSANYPFNFYYPKGTSSKPAVIANNLIYNAESEGTFYGMYFNNPEYVKVVHNTIIMDDQSRTSTSSYSTRLIYSTSSMPNCDISNNIFYLDREAGGTANMIYINGPIDVMGHNNFYAPAGAPSYTFGYLAGTSYTTFGDWQANSGLGNASSFANPFFVDAANHDYHPQSSVLDGAGVDYSAFVTTDIEGSNRGALADIGAYEFTGQPCTGVSGISTINVTGSSATAVWNSDPAAAIIEWGPVGFKQASITGTIINVPVNDTSATISGLNALTCYDYYITLNCTSTIPGAPPVMGPFSFCTVCAAGPLAGGVYTVGGTAGPNNFPTLDSAISRLQSCGISGPVTFNLASGTYAQQVLLTDVAGASATNTITFQADPANTAPTVIEYSATGTADNYVWSFEDASHYIVRGLTMNALGSSYARVLDYSGSCNNILVENNILNGQQGAASTSTNFAVVINNSAAANRIDNSTLKGNEINGGSYGVYWYGVSTVEFENGNTIDSNQVDGFYVSGIYAFYQNQFTARGNTVTTTTATTGTVYGIRHYYNDNLVSIGNKVVARGGNTIYGMDVYNCDATSAAPAIVANNMISALDNSGTAYGMNIYYTNYLNCYHNSVLINSGGASGGHAVRVSGSSSVYETRIVNNIFVNTDVGVAFESTSGATAGMIAEMNYNNYFSAGADLADWGGTAVTNLAGLQTANLMDANSVSGNPVFVSDDDLHALGSVTNNVGTPLTQVLIDIDGEMRSATTPDMGADEYVQGANDIALIGGDFIKGICLSTNDSIEVWIQNVIGPSANFVNNPLTVNYSVTGPVNSTGSIVVNTGTLPTTDTLKVYTGNIDLSVPGIYALNAYLDSNGVNNIRLNDTLLNNVTIEVKPSMLVSPKMDTLNAPTDSIQICANSSFYNNNSGFFITEISHWSSATTAGAPVGGWPSYLLADDYIEITGAPGSDLEGITLEQWSSTALLNSHTFPAGTVLGPNGTAIIAIGTPNTSVPSPSDFYYHGNLTTNFSSGTSNGRILKDADGNIIDAVGVGTVYNFPAASGVTAADWSGSAGSHGSMAGVRLEGPDLNNASNWVLSNASPQDPNTLNAGVPLPNPIAYSGLNWSYNGVVIDSVPCIKVAPSTPGVHTYIVSFTNSCGTFIDSGKVFVPSCLPVSNLGAHNITDSEATLTWDSVAVNSSNSYQVSYGIGLQSPIGAGATMVLTTADSLVVSGLTSQSNYCFFVREICGVGDTSAWAGPYCFDTECSAFVAPFVEDFEGSSVACWSNEAVVGTKAWTLATGSSGGAINTAHSGTLNARFTSSNGGPHITKLVSPVIDASSLTNTQIKFWYGQEMWFSDQNYLNVYYRDNASSAWVLVWSDSTNVTAWTQDSVIIPSTSATLQVAFEGVDNWARANVVDDIVISEAGSSCPVPSNVAVTNVSCDSVEVSWISDASATGSYIEYGIKGFSLGSGTIISNALSPEVINGLALNTEYDIYVVDSCSMNASLASQVYTIKTDSVGPIHANFTAIQTSATLTDGLVDVDATASIGDGLSYSWDFGNSTSGTGVSAQGVYSSNGTYSIVLTVTDRCGNTDDTTVVVTVAGISIVENAYDANIELYPNPNSGSFKVNVTNGVGLYTIEVSDLSGRVVYQSDDVTPGSAHTVELLTKAKGVYMVRLQGDGLNVTQRVVIE